VVYLILAFVAMFAEHEAMGQTDSGASAAASARCRPAKARGK
jgi:hypothetical protein